MHKVPKNFVDKPFAYHEELIVDIQSINNEGRGIARVNGWIVMVPFVIVGERVRVRIFKNNKNYSEADLIEVIKPSSARIKAPCPLFAQCGGCQYQHVRYEDQLLWKRQQIVDCLERIAKIFVPVNAVHPSEKTYAYRSKITPHFERTRTGDFPIGFLACGQRRQWVDVERCAIASDAINEVLPALRARVKENLSLKSGTLLLRDDGRHVITDPHQIAQVKVGDKQFQFPAGNFFQNNIFILNAILGYIRDCLKKFNSVHYLVDTYCGVGVFGIALSNYVERFMGIEIDKLATEWAQKNLSNNQVTNGAVLLGSSEAIFENITFPKDQTLVIMDPPRGGCSEEFLRQLVSFAPDKVIYISCAPDTQARDLRRLLDLDGSYKIVEVQPFDMFPQTKHVECVAVLSKGEL